MLTADEIRAMTDEEVKARLDACAVDLFGAQWKTEFARRIDYKVRAIHQWFEHDKRPPTWAILLAETWAHSRQIVIALKSYTAAVKSISDLSDTI